MSKKSPASLFILIIIIIVFYFGFGLFIVRDEASLGTMVKGYEAGYSAGDSSQAKGADLIKSNWNRVRGDNSLMQRQVDQSN